MSAICGQIPSRRTNSFRFFFFNEFDFIALGPLITRARSESKLQASERPRDLPCLVQGSRTLPLSPSKPSSPPSFVVVVN